jgi:DNA-binding MarR family transcriptional regulator
VTRSLPPPAEAGARGAELGPRITSGMSVPVADAVLFRLSYVIGRLDRAIRREMGDRLTAHGLGIPHYTVMSVLRNRPGLSNAQLARRSFVTPQAMNEVIARLEEAQLVTRQVDEKHRRILRATITARGRSVLDRVDGEIAELEEQMLGSVGEADRAVFVKVALQCVHSLGAGLPDV